jgi:transcription factor E2F7/8
VERRRIYDVINVFEALDLVQRKAKCIYLWHGTQRLHSTLVNLKARARLLSSPALADF